MTPLTFSDLMPATLVAAALLASWNDYRRHRVPNWLNAAVLTSGLIAQGAFPGGHGLTFALSGVFIGLAPLMLLWCMRAQDGLAGLVQRWCVGTIPEHSG